MFWTPQLPLDTWKVRGFTKRFNNRRTTYLVSAADPPGRVYVGPTFVDSGPPSNPKR